LLLHCSTGNANAPVILAYSKGSYSGVTEDSNLGGRYAVSLGK